MKGYIRYWVNGKRINLYQRSGMPEALYEDLNDKYIHLKNINVNDFYKRFTEYDAKRIITYIKERTDDSLEAGFIFIILTLPIIPRKAKHISNMLGTILNIYFDTSNIIDTMIECELVKYIQKDEKYKELVSKNEIRDIIATNPNKFLGMTEREKKIFIKRQIRELYKNKRKGVA